MTEEEISKLIKYNEKLKAALDKAMYERFIALGEIMRLRRMMGALQEEYDVMKKRAEKAERGLKNIKLWMQIKGVKGGTMDADSTE